MSSTSGRSAGTMAQNDPSELLEVFDASGKPTGRARSRAAIHLDGDWHQAFHCWILRRGGQEIVLQQRSAAKDTYPLCWDAAAAGHWRFGESAEKAAREIAEELGISVPFERLRWVGTEREERAFDTGLIDREFHQVYALDDFDAPLSSYRPDPSEVAALAAVSSAGLLDLVAGRLDRLPASEGEVTLRRQDLVPYSEARLRRLVARNLHPTQIVGNTEFPD